MRKTTFLLLLLVLSLLPAVRAAEYPLKQTFEPYITNGDLPGFMTIIADKDGIVQTDVFGFQNVEKQEPWTMDTVFWIASQSKPFVGVAVMMLVEENKLSLTEPLSTYVREFADVRVVAERNEKQTLLVPVERPLTLEHLMTHSSGLPPDPLSHRRQGLEAASLDTTLTLALITPLEAQPGTKSIYSNFGIDTAAAIVARVARMPFEDFIQQRILDPLGMKDTTFWPTLEQQARHATVYRLDKETEKIVPHRLGLIHPLEDRHKRFAEAGGGLFSTPTDLTRFFRMLLNKGELDGKRLLKEESVVEMAKIRLDPAFASGIGVRTNREGVFGHNGAAATQAYINWNKNYTSLFFAQFANIPKGNEARDKFYKLMNE